MDRCPINGLKCEIDKEYLLNNIIENKYSCMRLCNKCVLGYFNEERIINHPESISLNDPFKLLEEKYLENKIKFNISLIKKYKENYEFKIKEAINTSSYESAAMFRDKINLIKDFENKAEGLNEEELETECKFLIDKLLS